MFMRSPFLKRGFTLVELLVTIGIIGVLLALSIPAIQRLRETANFLWCKNNLRSIGSGMYEYVTAYKVFPTGGCAEAEQGRTWGYHFNPVAAEIPTTGVHQNWGWAFQILPYIGLEDQWKRPEYWSEKATQIPLMTYEQPVSLYFCPTRGRNPQVLRERWGVGFASIDYAANGGHLSFVDPRTGRENVDRSPVYRFPLTSINYPHSGVIGVGKSYRYGGMVIDPPLRISEIDDGASYTILLGEKRVNARLTQSASSLGLRVSVPQLGDRLGFCSGFSTDTIRTGAYPPSRDERDLRKQVADGFGSAHPRRFNVLFADGSVRDLAYDIGFSPLVRVGSQNLSLMQRLCHRRDGTIIDPSDLAK
jgi:prepilin-type N-terminal cleavage/methylation domain-containing protein/prepilin-type processing-associated H-X9-DG protein